MVRPLFPRVGFIDVLRAAVRHQARVCVERSAPQPTRGRPLGRLLCFPAAFPINARAGHDNNNNCWAGHAAHRARG